MKLLSIIALFAAATLPASSPAAPEQTEVPTATAEQPVKDVYARWSVIGEWRVTHPVWTDLVVLSADGSLITSRLRTTGRWTLTADAGTPLLVIRWDLYGTESVAMVSPNHFRGQTENGKFIDVRRGEELPDGQSGQPHAK